jgi:hypothetical protein
MGVRTLSDRQFAAASDEVVALVLRGCGIHPASADGGERR